MRIAVLFTAGLLLACNVASGQKLIVCYFSNSAVYRPGNGRIDISDIDAKLCTHLIYLTAGITDAGDVQSVDPHADLPENGGLDGYNRFNQLVKNSSVKTFIAIGGRPDITQVAERFSIIAANTTLRKHFVSSAIAFVKKHGFNGLDLQWLYPSQRDEENYPLLLQDLNLACANAGLDLSALFHGAPWMIGASYDLRRAVKYVDFANIITYDLHGYWQHVTGIHSPLYPGCWENGHSRRLNVDSIVNDWLSQGILREKMIISIPTYGRSFHLKSQPDYGIMAPASLPAMSGPYTKTPGLLGYNEICEELKTDPHWQYYYHLEQRVPYVVRTYYGNADWVGYDNVRSVEEKVNYIQSHNLGGAIVYTLDTDDFKGICGTKYPLLKAVNALRKN